MLEETLAKELAAIILEQQKPLRDEIAKLKSRVAELELGGIKYVGTFQRAAQYRKGDVTTFDGSMWIALDSITGPGEVPGTSKMWQLCCRHGRDLRDGKGEHAA